MIYKRVTLIWLIFIISSCIVQAKVKYISPIDFGVLNAQTGIERYNALLRCHTKALRDNCYVTYKGIDSIYIEIPASANGIPLTSNTDFCGVTIIVKNQTRDIFLFTMKNQLQPICLPAQQIDQGEFSDNDVLNDGLFIVVIEDKNPLVEERIDYGYPHIRKDVLLVENGYSKNRVVMPYNNMFSTPECTYRKVTKNEKILHNLRFIRSNDSTRKTGLFEITGENNIKIKNVYIYTPPNSELYGDGIITVENCTCVTFEDIIVDGTYSLQDKFGYAFNLNNLWKYTARRVKADGNWGVYGTNNMNIVLLEKCEINRFDIHCYGRDVTLKNDRFFKKYNSFCSTFGRIVYQNCIFDESIPYLNPGSYNAFVNVNLIFNNCRFYLTSDINYLVQMMGMSAVVNNRKELSAKHIPGILLNKCVVSLPDNLSDWYILRVGNYNKNMIIEGGNKISIHRLSINGGTNSTSHLQTNMLNLKSPFGIEIKKIKKNGKNSYINQEFATTTE